MSEAGTKMFELRKSKKSLFKFAINIVRVCMPFKVIAKKCTKIFKTFHFLNHTIVYKKVIIETVGTTKTQNHLFGLTCIDTEIYMYCMALIDKTFYIASK